MAKLRVPILRRGDVFYLRYRIPEHLKPLLGKSEIQRSLNISDRRHAAAVALRCAERLDNLKEMAMTHTLTTEEINRLVDEFIQQELERDLQNRADGVARVYGQMNDGTKQAADPAKAIETLELALDDRREELADDSYEESAQRIAEGLLGEFDEDNPTHRRLRHALGVAQVTVAKVKVDRERGIVSSEPTAAAIATSEAPKATPTISDAMERYIDAKAKADGWAENTIIEYRKSAKQFAHVVGGLAIGNIKAEHIRKLRDTMTKLPSRKNLQDKYRDLSTDEIVALGLPAADCYKPKTIKNIIHNLSAMFQWYVDIEGDITKNPAKRQAPKQGKKGKASTYENWPMDWLQRILDYKWFTSGEVAQPWYFWMLPIGLFSGMRINEIAQLRVKDIENRGGIWVFNVIDEDDFQRVKSNAARRVIPIHSRLVSFGFLEYVQALDQAGKLWPTLEPNKHGKIGAGPSNRYGEVFKELFPDRPPNKYTFHSLRGNFITEVTNNGAIEAHRDRIVGHAGESMAAQHYMGDVPLELLVDVVEKARYEKLNFSMLRAPHV